ncbi:MAG: PIN domain-containing protein [Actinomycetota bacterium]
MANVLLDTTVAIDLLRAAPDAVAWLRRIQATGDIPFVCAVTAEEVSVGLRPRERERAAALFEGLAPAPLTIAEGRLAGWWRRSFRSRGRTLSQGDCLIAASAVSIGARLATGNSKDFPMKDLEVELVHSGR